MCAFYKYKEMKKYQFFISIKHNRVIIMSDNIFICKICGKNDFKNAAGLSNHIIRFHKVSKKDYYDIYLKKDNEGICKFCTQKTAFWDIVHGYRLYCSRKCSEADTVNRMHAIYETYQERYGTTNIMELDWVKEKIKATCKKRYGVTHYNKSEESKIKHKKTYFDKTGYENPSQNPEVKQKKKETTYFHYGVENPNQSKDIIDKRRQTCLEKYNKISYAQTDEFKEKFKQTCLEKYNVDNPNKSEIIKEKKKQTLLIHFGVESPMYSDIIKEKLKQTMKEKYGAECASHILEIVKRGKKKYIYNNIMFDSSWEVAYYIYLIDHNVQFQYHPNIKFKYRYKGKIHYYMPDFLVNGHIIEIKGDQFFNKDGIMISLYNKENDHLSYIKQQCMKRNNVWILRNKDLQHCFDYINKQYGKNYIKQFKRK